MSHQDKQQLDKLIANSSLNFKCGGYVATEQLRELVINSGLNFFDCEEYIAEKYGRFI